MGKGVENALIMAVPLEGCNHFQVVNAFNLVFDEEESGRKMMDRIPRLLFDLP